MPEKGSQTKRIQRSRSNRAGLQLPVSRFHRQLRKGNYAERIGNGASVYTAAVIQYLVSEVLEVAGNMAIDSKRVRILPRHLQCSILLDHELRKLLSNIIIMQGGVLPGVSPVILTTSSSKKKSKK